MADDPEYPLSDHEERYVFHAVLNIGGNKILLADKIPRFSLNAEHNIMSIVITEIEVGVAIDLFNALSEGGKVISPLGTSYWSPAYGTLIDKFGVSWEISAI